jgi:predicted CDP-diglyceride synthetase/phosphatidate cytidylyltransferase
VNVNEALSESVRLTECHLDRATDDAQAVKRRIDSLTATVIEKFRHLLFILSHACLMTDKFDFEAESSNVYFDLSFFCFLSHLVMLLQVQNSDEMMSLFLFSLIIITHRRFVD